MTTSLPAYFRLATRPVADPHAVVQAGPARFTVLASRLLRLEYSPTAAFEDRPSQAFWHRQQPVPPFETRRQGEAVEIITPHVHLRYTGGAFTPDSLQITLTQAEGAWALGQAPAGNLLGTARTLDGASGQTKLELGLMSREGWAVVDDSQGLVFNEAGWLAPRRVAGAEDLYFFGYGHDYAACLADFARVSGPTPVTPRWALGNWWCRFWAYTQSELSELMLAFQAHGVPLSVCVIDMDWHLDGWTGYTWNRELWPDPAACLAWLHGLGLKSALNLHPAEGVGPHEAQYSAMAQALGIDPASQKPVPFDLENPAFAVPYFDLLHHPQERAGVDFWWMDWQQGNPSKLPGLNLLWWINHLHFYDLGRDPEAKRPFIFSRWGGLGNHRYPIGFSGDTVVTWEALAFQPYFTATAANVGYGWWSHDIGGHMGGIANAELYARWVQFGVFSPILRLHSTKDPYQERCPWGYDAETFRVVKAAMQQRHAFIPYLYSMAYRNYLTGLPPVQPMYHLAPEAEPAYACPNQYTFGSELIAAPYITPADPEVGLARQVVWLPTGDWYGFENDQHYAGGWHGVYGGLDEVPVFAKAGAIVPLGPRVAWGGVENPAELTVHIFPGADNHFDLYEDDGVSGRYLAGAYALTPFDLKWSEAGAVFSIGAAQGQVTLVPPQRTYTLVFHAVEGLAPVEAELNGAPLSVTSVYDEALHRLTLSGLRLNPTETAQVRLRARPQRADRRAAEVRKLLRALRTRSDVKQALAARLDDLLADPGQLAAYLVGLTRPQARALVEVLAGAGVEHLTQAGEALVVVWNNRADPRLTYTLAVEALEAADLTQRFQLEDGVAPEWKIIRPERDFRALGWNGHYPALLQVDYAHLFRTVILMKVDAAGAHPPEGLF